MSAERVLKTEANESRDAHVDRLRFNAAPISLSVIVPTFNERENVHAIVDRLDLVLQSISWEVIFVDDNSPDRTADVVRELARTDRRVRLISRHNRRGLGSAVVEGGLAAVGEIIAVMDGDLQHDENVLPELYRRVASGEAEIASASRFLEDHAREGLSSDARLKMSNTGIAMANKFFGLDLTDPLTGFFAMRRKDLERTVPRLSGLGFKILLDLITSMEPRPRVSEAPFRFRARIAGESKLDNRVKYDFMLFFLEKTVGRFAPIPGSWLSLAIISSLGILVHMAFVVPAVSLFGMPFEAAQLVATLGSLFATFTVNNTLSQSGLKGNRFWSGFLIFSLLCAVGVLANVGVASLLHSQFDSLVYVVPALVGALVSVVWNFVAGKAFWRWKKFLLRSRTDRLKEKQSVPETQTPVENRDWPAAPALSKHKHLLKYLIIGATASAIDVVLFLILYNLVGTSALVAHSVSVPASVLFSFFVNARHNFKTSDHMVLRLVSFVLVCTVGYMSGFGVIELCRQQGLDANIGKIISLPVVFAIQYVLNSRITFYTPRRA